MADGNSGKNDGSGQHPVGSTSIVEGSAVPESVQPSKQYVRKKLPKKGTKCFGFCCDFRRAVVYVAVFNILLSLIGVFRSLLFVASAKNDQIVGSIDDDSVLYGLQNSNRANGVFAGISLVSSSCALVGGLRYNADLVGVNIAWMVASFLATTIISIHSYHVLSEQRPYQGIEPIPTSYFLFSGVLATLCLYPQIGFVLEVKSGILSFQNHAREDYSCCCKSVAKRSF